MLRLRIQGEEGMAKLVREVPEGLPEARTKMMSLVEEVCKHAGNIPFHRVMLGGFSQVSLFYFLWPEVTA